MKRFLLILTILAVLFAGCGEKDPAATTDAAALPPETTAAPETTEAPGLYDPNSVLEAGTNGAVRAYPLKDGFCAGMMPMGDGILLFYAGDTTVLSLVRGETLTVAAETELDCLIFPNEADILVREDAVIYYDSNDNTLVTLNGLLQEVSRLQMPDEMAGTPAISPDGKLVYYAAGPEIRVLDLHSGISRLLREQTGQRMSLTGLYCDGAVLRVYVEAADADSRTEYLSAENGETVHYGGDAAQIHTRGDRFYAELSTEDGTELVFGQAGGENKTLEPAGTAAWINWLPEMDAAVNCALMDNGWTLDYYDLTTGLRTASLTLPEDNSIWNLLADPGGECIWFLNCQAGSGGEVLCRWEPEKSAVEDETVYTDHRYTASDPDLEGIALCRQEADRIGKKYGVKISLWNDALAVQPWDYVFKSEYRVKLMEQALETLDQSMARYPEGFFRAAAELSETGMIQIALVGGIYGDPEQGALASSDGVQYWIGTEPYIALRLCANLEMNFYHEMFHVIENRVFGKTVIYDDWEDLNPRDFEYDFDYIANQNRTDTAYLEGEDRAFIDFYSMSYPKEDRARIMEYAMVSAGAECFQSDRMQEKLLRLCRGIREAFELEDHPEILPWEQYLDHPLVPDAE